MAGRDLAPDVIDEEIVAVTSAVSRVRGVLRSWLTRSGVDDGVAHEVVIATNEALANALEHGSPDSAALIRVRAECVAGVVRIEVTDAGSEALPPPDPNRGRGLAMMRALMDSVEVVPSAAGTTVRMERSIAGVPGRE